MPPQSTSKQFLGLAKEAVKGTAEATPTSFIPIRTLTGGREKTKLPDNSLRGSAVDSYAEADGVYHGTFSIEGDVFVDTFGHYLKAILGEEAISGAGPYVHTFNVLNSGDQQPPSHTLWDNYAVVVRRYPGAQFTSLNISWDDPGLVSYKAEAMTLADATIAAPTASYGTLSPLPGWTGACVIGGTQVFPLSGELNISRANPEAVHVQDNSQGPRNIWMGPVVVEGTTVLLMEDDTYYTQFINNTQPLLQFTFTASASQVFDFVMSKVTWRDPEIDRSGSYVKLKLGYKALGNTTDVGASGGLSNIKATLTNSRATVY